MANNHMRELVTTDELYSLIQPNNFVGWVYSLDYDNALIITNDAWKNNVKGIPHNSFLVAAPFTQENYGETAEMDREVILLRVMGACKLPQDDDAIRTKLDNFQNQTELYPAQGREDFDAITKNKLQFGGLACRVLGTFYMKNNALNLGSDIESFSMSLRMSVYVPKGYALETIVNYIDPIRKKRAKEDFRALGITSDIRLTEITEENWLEAASLSVKEEQKRFLAPAVGILARGYVYRSCNARVRVIENDGTIVGLALVREFTDEPLGYDLQQFMIDENYQGKGYGSAALALILEELRTEGRFDHVEVCVKKDDAAAIRLYEKHGFTDSGYVDPDVPDSVNLICQLR